MQGLSHRLNPFEKVGENDDRYTIELKPRLSYEEKVLKPSQSFISQTSDQKHQQPLDDSKLKEKSPQPQKASVAKKETKEVAEEQESTEVIPYEDDSKLPSNKLRQQPPVREQKSIVNISGDDLPAEEEEEDEEYGGKYKAFTNKLKQQSQGSGVTPQKPNATGAGGPPKQVEGIYEMDDYVVQSRVPQGVAGPRQYGEKALDAHFQKQ